MGQDLGVVGESRGETLVTAQSHKGLIGRHNEGLVRSIAGLVNGCWDAIARPIRARRIVLWWP